MTVTPSSAATWHNAITDINAVQWNSLCRDRDRPFLQWEWLHLLEASGCVGGRTGWLPRHLTIGSRRGLQGAAALYLKEHSEGEFVFDHAWSQLASSMGIVYYPKMVGMSPFTPVSAYRFLVAPEADETLVTMALLREIESYCRAGCISGCGFHFVVPGWGRIPEGLGYRVWLHQGFTWLNAGFGSFEDYLGGLKSGPRRSIRRERERLRSTGIQTRRLFAQDIPDEYFSLMYEFYARHNDSFGRWSCKFLTPGFFQRLRKHFRDQALITAAFAPGESEPLAMALLLVSGDRLFGRYWGARAEVEFLHFELCYYQPMEWMIQRGIRLFDPGMGGVHKAFRGFVSTPSYSLHRFFDPRLHLAMDSFIPEYNHMEMRELAVLNSILPYRRRV